MLEANFASQLLFSLPFNALNFDFPGLPLPSFDAAIQAFKWLLILSLDVQIQAY
jgi:hypothetical protein